MEKKQQITVDRSIHCKSCGDDCDDGNCNDEKGKERGWDGDTELGTAQVIALVWRTIWHLAKVKSREQGFVDLPRTRQKF